MTKGFLNVADEATAMARLVGANVDEIKDKSDVRLMLAINKLVIAEVVTQYTLIDEMLAEIIVRHFFDIEPDVLHFEKAWPESRKENRATGKVLYESADIRSLDGLRQFKDDAATVYRYLYDRVYGPELGGD